MLFRKKEKSDRDLEVNPFYKDKNALIVYIKCDKCGEVFRSHLRIGYDFIINYDDRAAPFMIDKVYVGSKCPSKIELKAKFTGSYKPVSIEIDGGKFISKETYEEEVKG
ncbi:MAG: hypothetical protein KBE50_06245 [Fervidobacterium sp.]|nr:hypothetical protein [Fervidobacterium sp.]MBP9518902.1 hypothetical protein [Fervidobacterium sp.]HOA16989.1 hypothetical protein [Fervidobacterium sp.]